MLRRPFGELRSYSFNWLIRPANHVRHHGVEHFELSATILGFRWVLPTRTSHLGLTALTLNPSRRANLMTLIVDDVPHQLVINALGQVAHCRSWQPRALLSSLNCL